MSEVTDLVMPVLQKVQADLAEVKGDLAEVKRVQAGHTEKFEEMEIYLAYATGLAKQNKNGRKINRIRDSRDQGATSGS